jgi:hypothetical protein
MEMAQMAYEFRVQQAKNTEDILRRGLVLMGRVLCVWFQQA